MKTLLEQIIRLRNPHFRFDESVTSRLLLAFAWSYGRSYLRGLRLLLLAKMPRHVLLGRGVGFFNSSNIRLGRWVKLGDHVQLSAAGTGELVIGDHSGIGAFSRVVIATSFNQLGSHIRIGKNVGIGEFAYLVGGGGLEIGDDCIVGQYFSCHPENHITVDPHRPIRMQGVTRKGIRVGKDCWIGSKVTILDGVEIGDHCVIAAGAVVTRSMPSGSVIAGVPARVIRSRSVDEPVTCQHRAS